MDDFDRERMRVLDALLDRALDLPDDERAGWLDELRARSPTLAAEVDALLGAEAEADRLGFLATPLAPPPLAGLPTRPPRPSRSPGSAWAPT